jgi:hypothetical protein
MPKPNAFRKVSKKLQALLAKADKLHVEIKSLGSLVDAEAKKVDQAQAAPAKTAAKPRTAKPVAKAKPAAPVSAVAKDKKKPGRPKVK